MEDYSIFADANIPKYRNYDLNITLKTLDSIFNNLQKIFNLQF